MTVINQGVFTSTGVAKTLQIRSDVDWMQTINYTNCLASTQWDAVRHYWQRGLAANDGFAWYHAAATAAESFSTCAAGWNGAVYPGFTLVDSSLGTLGAAIAVTAGTNATQPVYSTANVGNLTTGSIVRVTGTAHTNLNGLDFTVDAVTPATSFRLQNTLATAPGVIAGAAGFWRLVAPDLATYNLFYPGNRVIANITQASPAVVTTLVDHGLTTGQRVRIKVPTGSGMVEINGLEGTVTYVSAGTFSIDIDSTGFTAYNFPLPGALPVDRAQVIPIGISLSTTTLLTDATRNQSYLGMILGAGAGSPAGENNDVIYWTAGKSFSNTLG
jgi:hypothetical protein